MPQSNHRMPPLIGTIAAQIGFSIRLETLAKFAVRNEIALHKEAH